MHFRKLITLVLVLSATWLSAQDVKQHIANEFTAYQDAIAAGDFEVAMEYISPDFFTIYPKESIIELMETTFNNPSITFEIKDLKIENIEDLKEIDGKHYALLNYSNRMLMKFHQEGEENEENKKSRLAMTQLSLEQTFGSNNVQYDPKTDFFGVAAGKSVYAISANGKTDWKFLVLEKDQKEILQRILPRELLIGM